MSDKRYLLTVILLLMCFGARAELLRDPMRPYKAEETIVKGKSTSISIKWDLSAILYSEQRRVAVVNGKSVSEGERIGAAVVQRISRREIELNVDGQLIKVALTRNKPTKINRSQR